MNQLPILPTGISYDISEELYRADLGLNQSTLKKFGQANSPAHFRYEEQRPRKETPELRIGNFVDATLFAPKKLLSFALWPEHRKGKAWETFEQANSTKTILNGPEMERGRSILKALEAHDDATKLIKACQYQVVCIGEHPQLKFRMKGAIDLLPDLSRCSALLSDFVFDLKCTADASDEGFAKQCVMFGYHIQAAYYMDLLILCGRQVKTFGFIAAENDKPHGIKIHWFPIDSLEIRRARELYEKWMFEYMECVKRNVWPSYSSEWTRIRFKPRMLDEVERHADVLE